MKKFITYKGKILFDPIDLTKKHKNQSNWKRVALVSFCSEISEYYAWFLEKRYGLKLNKPLRGSHVSFINDSIRDIKKGLKCNEKDAYFAWDKMKERWDGKEIRITFDVDARSNGKHWWIKIPEKERKLLHYIRKEIGLGIPYWGLHMSIGYANEKNLQHSKYIVGLAKKYGNGYN